MTTADRYAPLTTPVGTLLIAFREETVTAVARNVQPDVFETWFARRFQHELKATKQLPPLVATSICADLEDGGQRTSVDIEALTPFHQAVLTETRRIPYGTTRTYGWIAEKIGCPAAVRAVGTALAHNPIPFLIPCHRVVRSDGTIGNYSAGGSAAKLILLATEQQHVAALAAAQA